MSQSAAGKAKADRYPVELKPNPDYEYEPPRQISDTEVEIDAGCIEWAEAIAAAGKKRGFPRNQR